MKQQIKKEKVISRPVYSYPDLTVCVLCGSPECSHRFRNKYLCEECMEYILSQ